MFGRAFAKAYVAQVGTMTDQGNCLDLCSAAVRRASPGDPGGAHARLRGPVPRLLAGRRGARRQPLRGAPPPPPTVVELTPRRQLMRTTPRARARRWPCASIESSVRQQHRPGGILPAVRQDGATLGSDMIKWRIYPRPIAART